MDDLKNHNHDDDFPWRREDDDDFWPRGRLTERPPMSRTEKRKAYRREAIERERNRREAAIAEGRQEAFIEIMERGEAIRDLAMEGDQTNRETWKAQGALEIWRVAYAAAYRDELVAKDQATAMVCGAGLPSELTGITPPEVEHAIENAKYYVKMGWRRRTRHV